MKKSVHTNDYKALRAELRAIRQKARLSQRDLAAKLGVAHSWVAKVEAGERRIDVVELAWYFSACGEDAAAATSALVSQFGRGGSHRGRSS
ncbi:MAG: helix-turn-helix domain-containing protein [Gemmataceae bacterium]|nr:helix-turn-helix domain-containing protein [Gemmataceae bacterium]